MIKQVTTIFFMIRISTINLLLYEYWKNIGLADVNRFYMTSVCQCIFTKEMFHIKQVP